MLSKEDLKNIISEKLGDYKIVVVSNREPYIHEFVNNEIRCVRPASGLVTALDPVLQACGGIWVAHGSGSADREVVDKNDHIDLPPSNPTYYLRRLWLTKIQEEGYYYGLANQSLWPLCHIVYVRPNFDENNWKKYVELNDKFARAVVDEIAGRKALVLIQDYHLALCAKFIKEKNPELITGQFWHIPWPNPEAFRICPWKQEILEGLLANELLGFHIKYHCDNFLSTVDLNVECKIDREISAVTVKGHTTYVKPFPISIDFDGISKKAKSPEVESKIKDIKRRMRIPHQIMAVGLDRVDYTKGIPERLFAIDRFLEKYPEYKKKFIYVGLGAPSRVHIKEYKDLGERIETIVDEINWKHGEDNWQPIIYIQAHITYEEILAYYRMADLCIVSSLHDGMNLVAKEFIAAQEDVKKGMLILSQFVGASRELAEAVLINPYDIERFADAIKFALEIPKEEKEKKMSHLIEVVKENNIYNWAAAFITELKRIETSR